MVNGSEDETIRAEVILIGIAVSNDKSVELALATQTAKERYLPPSRQRAQDHFSMVRKERIPDASKSGSLACPAQISPCCRFTL